MFAAGTAKVIEFILSIGQLYNAPYGRIHMETAGKQKTVTSLLMDKAYEDDHTLFIAQMLKFNTVVPLKSNLKGPWEYDKELYKLRNEIERPLRLIQSFRRVFWGMFLNWCNCRKMGAQ